MKAPAPFVVRLSQLCWVLSLVVGGAAVVYLFVIRQAQLPEMIEIIRQVDATRADETYTAAADIIYWSVFGALVGLLFIQIMLQVSFANRRPNVRWWQFGMFLAQVGVFLIAGEFVATGDRGIPLERLLLLQLGLQLLGLLLSALPPALHWTARQHDVRRGTEGPTGADF